MMKLLSLSHFFALPCIVTAAGLFLAACGTSDPAPVPAGPKYTVDNVCEKIAPDVCALREPCCTQASGYDETGCITNQTTECEKNVADVKAGIMTFDGDSVDACLEAQKPYADKCYLTVNDFFTVPQDLEACTRVFAGKLTEGTVCDRTSQCMSSLSDRELVQCDEMTKKCTTTRFLPLDASCKLGQNIKDFCDAGTYCNFDFLSMSGKCKTTTPLSAACSPGPLSLECGLGFMCDSMTKVCVEAGTEGEACMTALDCKSVTCTGGMCVKPNPLFSKQECTGMP